MKQGMVRTGPLWRENGPVPTLLLNQSLLAFLCIFSLKKLLLLCCLRPTRPFIVNWNAVLFFLVILCASGGLRNHCTFVCQHSAKRRRVAKSFFPSIFPHECSMLRALLILVQQQIPKYSRKLIHHQTLFRVGYLCSNRRVAWWLLDGPLCIYWPNVWSLFQTALTRWRHWSAPGSPCDFYHHWSCNCCQRPYAQWVSGGHFFHTLPVSKGQVLFGGSTMENRSGQREGYWNSAQWRVNIVLRVHLIYMCSEYLLNARMFVCRLICARV